MKKNLLWASLFSSALICGPSQAGVVYFVNSDVTNSNINEIEVGTTENKDLNIDNVMNALGKVDVKKDVYVGESTGNFYIQSDAKNKTKTIEFKADNIDNTENLINTEWVVLNGTAWTPALDGYYENISVEQTRTIGRLKTVIEKIGDTWVTKNVEEIDSTESRISIGGLPYWELLSRVEQSRSLLSNTSWIPDSSGFYENETVSQSRNIDENVIFEVTEKRMATGDERLSTTNETQSSVENQLVPGLIAYWEFSSEIETNRVLESSTPWIPSTSTYYENVMVDQTRDDTETVTFQVEENRPTTGDTRLSNRSETQTSSANQTIQGDLEYWIANGTIESGRVISSQTSYDIFEDVTYQDLEIRPATSNTRVINEFTLNKNMMNLNPDTINVTEYETNSIDLSEIMLNDIPYGDDIYSFVRFEAESGGTISFAPDVISFTPNLLEGNTGGFTYVIENSRGFQLKEDVTLNIIDSPKNEIILDSGLGARTWEDGSYAVSCNEYFNSTTPNNSYIGDIGDGEYMIDIDGAGGSPAVIATCNMTTNGGGWTGLSYFDAKDLGFTTTVVLASGDGVMSEDANGILRVRDGTAAVGHYHHLEFPIMQSSQFYMKGYQIKGYASGPNTSEMGVRYNPNWTLANSVMVGDIAFGNTSLISTSYVQEGLGVSSCISCTGDFTNESVYNLSSASTTFRIGYSEGGGELEGWYPWYSGMIYFR